MAESRLEIAIDSRGAEANARAVRRELEGMERAGNTASRAARSTAGGFGRIARQSQLAVPPVSQLTSLLGGLAGVIGTQQIIGYSDAWQNAGNQLRQVTESAEELAGTQERLMQVANSTRSDFASTAGLYSRLARSTTELGLNQEDLIGLTRTINQSFAVSGATAEEAAAAITQLSQGLAAGALRGDEFNSVSEQAPGIMRAIAESLDMTIGDLRAFAAEGGITAEIVVNALQDSADAIENDFGRAVATFGQNLTVARNNLIQFVGDSETVEGGVANIGEAIVGLSENLDAVGQAATVVAGIFAGRMAGRFVTVAAGMTSAAGAATALRTAMAFLGGPVGILVGAGGLLYAFREELGLIPEPARSVASQVDEISKSMEGLGNAMLDVQVAAFGAELVQIELQAERLSNRIKSLKETANDPTSFGQGQQGDLSEGIARAEAEQQDLTNRAEAIRKSVEGLERFRRVSDDAADTVVKTKEQAGLLGETAEVTTKALKDNGDASGDAADSIDKFAGAAESAAVRLNRAGGGADPRYNIKAGGDTFSERARARFEASAFRVGDAGVRTFGNDGTARPTHSTALYDSAGSAIPRTPSAASGATGGGPHLGTLTLAGKDGGKIDVQANAPELEKFVTAMLSDAASSV